MDGLQIRALDYAGLQIPWSGVNTDYKSVHSTPRDYKSLGAIGDGHCVLPTGGWVDYPLEEGRCMDVVEVF